MDLGKLSDKTYRAIMIESEIFNHDLTLQFGLLSGECKDENIFVEKSLELIKEMKNYDLADIDDIFFGNPPEINDFHNALKKIKENIIKIKNIHFEKTTYFYG